MRKVLVFDQKHRNFVSIALLPHFKWAWLIRYTRLGLLSYLMHLKKMLILFTSSFKIKVKFSVVLFYIHFRQFSAKTYHLFRAEVFSRQVGAFPSDFTRKKHSLYVIWRFRVRVNVELSNYFLWPSLCSI